MKTITTSMLLFIIVALEIISNNTFAQQGFSIQFNAQPHLSFITGDWNEVTGGSSPNYAYSPYPKKSTFGYAFDLNANYNFTGNMGLMLGIGYYSQGQNYNSVLGSFTYSSNDNESSNESQTIDLSYIKVPIAITFNSDPSKKVSFNSIVGFYIGFLSSYNYHIDYSSTRTYINSSNKFVTENDKSTVDIKGTTGNETGTSSSYDGTKTTSSAGSAQVALSNKLFKTVDFGATIGLGIQIKLSEKIYLPIMFKTQFGFTDIHNTDINVALNGSTTIKPFYQSTNPNNTNSFKNSLVGLSIGIKYCL